MRLSTSFGRTLREAPAEAELDSHKLALRAALMRPLAAGLYTYMPFGWRVLKKIEHIFREEMDAIGGQDMSMPVVNPADIWRATGRYDAPAPGPTLVRFKDRNQHDMVLAITHEEVVADLLKSEVSSYRQLPFMCYHIQIKFRDEPRSRGGLIRTREFTMKDAYSCHTSAESLDEFYPLIYQAYVNIFRRCGIETIAVAADSGVMGGKVSHEFMAVSDSGEDTLVNCPQCGYAANADKATFARPEGVQAAPGKLEEVATPGCKTIDAVAAFVGVPTPQTLKVVFCTTQDNEVVMALIRGDLEVNLTKLSNALGGADLRSSTEEDLRAAKVVAGYASPVGLHGMRIIGDESIGMGNNLVAGANREGYHLKNVNYPRDFQVTALADIAQARAGDRCSQCGGTLKTTRGIECGHLFKLGTRYSDAVGATFLDKDGKQKPIFMGSYGIGTGRLMQVIIEQHHDERGIIWPNAVAPYQFHLLSLGSMPEIVQAAEDLYKRMTELKFEVLYDDRDETAGVKFADADLIGIPWRIAVSPKTLAADSVEVKGRTEAKPHLVNRSAIEGELAKLAHPERWNPAVVDKYPL